MKIYSLLYITAAILVLCSCQKIVTLKLNNANPEIVIQGEVTDAPGPYTVSIQQSANFYADNSFPAVTGAIVKITDDQGFTDSLRESSPGIYLTQFMMGRQGGMYQLSVNASGTSYSATSMMPSSVKLDSLTVDGTSGFGKQRIDVVANFQDPAGVNNYYQFNELINGKSFPQNYYTFDDRLSDGKYINYTLRTDSSYIKSGDTVTVSMYSVDENMYTYFSELRQSSGTGAFSSTASPANPTTNLSGGALGYFSAHTIQTATIIVQ
jgi:hypothetical protein